MLPWSGGSVCRLFSINSSCAWNWTVRRGSLLSTTSSPFLAVLEFRDVEESEGECRLIPGPYTDILGCSIRRSSIGLASKTSGESPLASKQGGGVTYQLSSSWIWAFNLGSSFSFSSVENKSERWWFWGNANLEITEKEIWCHHSGATQFSIVVTNTSWLQNNYRQSEMRENVFFEIQDLLKKWMHLSPIFALNNISKT